MSAAAIKFRHASELRASSHRAVGFLHGDSELTAQQVFQSVPENVRRYVLDSMDSWISGNDKPATRFHGFPNSLLYSMCFVFKAKENRQGHRFYGFLCHPLIKSNPRFQLCVLCRHASKNEQETDLTELAKTKKWSLSNEAQEAIAETYLDKIVSIEQGRKRK